jgi:hypothetical protein
LLFALRLTLALQFILAARLFLGGPARGLLRLAAGTFFGLLLLARLALATLRLGGLAPALCLLGTAARFLGGSPLGLFRDLAPDLVLGLAAGLFFGSAPRLFGLAFGFQLRLPLASCAASRLSCSARRWVSSSACR